jgi:hypothetical protein
MNRPRRQRGRRPRTLAEIRQMPVLTLGLIARLCDCCRNTVKWWVDHGLLPSRQGTDPFQGARATLVRREDLEAFLKARGMPDFLDP